MSATGHAGDSAPDRSAAASIKSGRSAWACGEADAAIAALRDAVSVDRNSSEAWLLLADVLRACGRRPASESAYLASVRASIHDAELVSAGLAISQGRLAVAERVLRARLSRRPTEVAAIRMLGEVAVRIGRFDESVKLLQRAVDLCPAFSTARELLARTLNRADRSAEALIEVNRLLTSEPRNPSHALLKASILVRIGEQEAARGIYEEVLARHPHDPKTWMSLGHVLKSTGSQHEAIAAYRSALTLQPTLGEAWWSLANLKTVGLTALDIEQMERALRATTHETDVLHLHFALGKAHEDKGADAAAFSHYAAGNRIRRAQLDYSAEATHDECVRATTLFTREFLESRRNAGCPAPDPIFIVGLPRAGSTLIEQILASHSLVEGTMELPTMMSIATRLAKPPRSASHTSYPLTLAELSPATLRELGEEYLHRTRIQRKTDRPYFIDKMPNNWAHVGLIQLILPNAKIIDARRHPLGCCFSAWKQHFARGQAFSYDLVELGRYYCDYQDLLAHFDVIAPGRVHRVVYEKMVADTENEIRRLLSDLGLPFEENCLHFWRNDRVVRTASSEQVRKPIFTDSVAHWVRFEAWLTPLIQALGAGRE